ncbi:hypothetical protein LHJ74_15730 [Streptomyces sp. N2-109]|uniref:Uncharacterized protein n=1 Tax=Streptomyces gossypii TaxID=2883101 RepID=A0ABT2JVR5_9ACTN|nr:hypothetical protein [Streptomyces gossypii]MCT2591339.1 hypothetical protein [Streptomyces gossypii]
MRAVAGLWRWRRNPLCRRSDRREAWLALWALLLILFVAPVVGMLSGVLTHEELLATVRAQRLERHAVWATAEQLTVPRRPLDSDTEDSAESEGRRGVIAYWSGPDGATRTGPADVGHEVRPGDRFRVWTNDDGELTSPPLSGATASSQAMLAGVVAAAATAAAVEIGRRLAVRQLLRRRYARWDDEWARIGPDSGRAGTNS